MLLTGTKWSLWIAQDDEIIKAQKKTERAAVQSLHLYHLYLMHEPAGQNPVARDVQNKVITVCKMTGD